MDIKNNYAKPVDNKFAITLINDKIRQIIIYFKKIQYNIIYMIKYF
jgi:hypothetical protein